MNEKKIRKAVIAGGIAAALLISVSTVIAYRPAGGPLKALLENRDLNQRSATGGDESPPAFITDTRPESGQSPYNKGLQSFQENNVTEKRDKRKIHYTALPVKEKQGKGNFKENRNVLFSEGRDPVKSHPAVQKQDAQAAAPALSSSSKQTAPVKYTESVQAIKPGTENIFEYSYEASEKDNTPDYENQKEDEEADYNVSVSRSVVSGSYAEGEVDVLLSISIDSSPPGGLILSEHIPEGWELVESVPVHRTYNTLSGQMKWLFIGSEVENMKIHYRIARKGTTGSRTVFSGNYLFNNPDGERVEMQTRGINGV